MPRWLRVLASALTNGAMATITALLASSSGWNEITADVVWISSAGGLLVALKDTYAYLSQPPQSTRKRTSHSPAGGTPHGRA